MKRLIFSDLIKWQNSPHRKPLLLRGARQVGKTHVTRKLGELFEEYVEINFEKKPDLKALFEYDLDPQRICRELSIALNKKIEPGKTLLFLDEVQEAPKAITALRYFYEEMPELHVIAAGSLVDFAIDKVGVPVGRIEFLYMYPLSFMEYLLATGNQRLAQAIMLHNLKDIMNPAIHNQALKLLGEYMIIGGMPEVVYQWVKTQDFFLCNKILNNIKGAYEQDFSKYAKKNEIKYVELLFKQIPSLVCQHFKYGHLTTTYRKRELEPSLYLLEKAGIIHLIARNSGEGVPLGALADNSKFKLILHDIGLTQAMLGLELKEWLLSPSAALSNKGGMTESFVGQELLAYANASDKHKLYYWHREQRSSQAEVDYLLTLENNIIPLEVKSGHGGGLQSLRVFWDTYPTCPYGLRLSVQNYSVFEKLYSYPLYAVASIIENKNKIIDFLS